MLNATVTVSSTLMESVAVNVREEPAFSFIDAALLESVTVGADSFSVIVIVTDCVPLSVASAPETPHTAMTAASSSS